MDRLGGSECSDKPASRLRGGCINSFNNPVHYSREALARNTFLFSIRSDDRWKDGQFAAKNDEKTIIRGI
jgi:hypothetical protein